VFVFIIIFFFNIKCSDKVSAVQMNGFYWYNVKTHCMSKVRQRCL